MPGEGHVFDPLFAAILNQRERQSVFGAATETVFSWAAFASFRRVPARFLNCDGISGYCNIAPNVVFGSDDIEGVISFDRPDGAERIGPGADESP